MKKLLLTGFLLCNLTVPLMAAEEGHQIKHKNKNTIILEGHKKWKISYSDLKIFKNWNLHDKITITSDGRLINETTCEQVHIIGSLPRVK